MRLERFIKDQQEVNSTKISPLIKRVLLVFLAFWVQFFVTHPSDSFKGK